MTFLWPVLKSYLVVYSIYLCLSLSMFEVIVTVQMYSDHLRQMEE